MDTNTHGQPVFTVEEISFTYFYLFGVDKQNEIARTVPYPPTYEELDSILTGWEKLCRETGCHIFEWSLSPTEFVAGFMDQNRHLISCIYVKGHA